MKLNILILFVFISKSLFSQFSEEIITTDTSEITITRNSLYKITNEVLKNKDSIWYSVRYIKDTNQIKTEGWLDKTMNALGVWTEYREDGTWLNTTEYAPYIFTYNDSLYPYHQSIEYMKLKADSILQQEYGKVFFNKNVIFRGGAYAYYNSEYLGNWSEPFNQKPNNFKFCYVLDCKSLKYLNQAIYIHVDSSGNQILSYEDGFEKIPKKIKKRGFILPRDQIVMKFMSKQEKINDTTELYEFTTWESDYKSKKYNGHYHYNIAIKQGETIKYENNNNKTYSITNSEFKIYSFSVWNGKLKSVQIINTSNDYSNPKIASTSRWYKIQL